MGDAVRETEHVAQVRRGVHVLLPDGYDAGQIAHGIAGVAESGLQAGSVGREPDHHEMDVLRTQRFLPVLGSVLPHVPKLGRSCGHSLLELGREAGK